MLLPRLELRRMLALSGIHASRSGWRSRVSLAGLAPARRHHVEIGADTVAG